jgi:hypothetical protein
MTVWTEVNWLRTGFNGEFLCHGNGPSGSIKGGEFLDQLRNYHFVKKTLHDGVVPNRSLILVPIPLNTTFVGFVRVRFLIAPL